LSETPPGWYPDPNDSTTNRYWDGQQWTDDRSPRQADQAAGPKQEKPKQNILLFAIPGAVILVGLIVFFALRGGGEAGDEFPQAAQDSFISSCEDASGGDTSACECALDRVQEEFTYEEVQDINADILAGEPPPAEFIDATSECA
jgi:hypothetical protein